ncbi:putative dipeptidase [Anaerosolibacter carboniphilus]|uniref:Putative dipeptidase n=1 Tax=Anaerosolibacter carboniphilus TaxID=1417629 RepID=A0A841KYY2_9FIRM|nr:dipeptidase PepV [Anaerosolibacter carboniphilus]MBB6218691.1 putative dipeptidase [Anaerosolibacter carboniphilus]
MQEIDKKIDELKDEMIESIQSLVRIKSVEDSPVEGMPFGEGVDQALRHTLEIAENMGFRVKYGNGYYGYAEIGEGEEMIGILGHVDVVPEGDLKRWCYPPYGGEIHEGRIFGRGAVDDKGPVIAALYAMKAVQELSYPIRKRVRLIVGVNEETRWECIKKYKELEETPSCGFTPDSDYPLIFAEKGLLQFQLVCNKARRVFVSGGNAYNSVPDHCTYNFQNNPRVIKVLEELHFDYERDGENVTVLGKGAHSAKAFLGKNAIARLCIALKQAEIETEAIDFIAEMVGEDCYAQKIVGNCEDEPSGKLTFNVAKIDLNDEQQVIGVDIRFPVTKRKEEIIKMIQAAAEKYDLVYQEIDYLPPLYVPNEHKLVQQLRKVFEDETGLDSTPIAAGGATYARAFENFVAFGPTFPGGEKLAHQADEYIEIDTLVKSLKMYTKAIAELAK